MITLRSLTAAFVALGLSACVSAAPPASRGAMQGASDLSVTTSAQNGVALPAGTVFLQAQYDVQAINVSVPQSLRSSEANSFHPNADIVWRGEPLATVTHR